MLKLGLFRTISRRFELDHLFHAKPLEAANARRVSGESIYHGHKIHMRSCSPFGFDFNYEVRKPIREIYGFSDTSLEALSILYSNNFMVLRESNSYGITHIALVFIIVRVIEITALPMIQQLGVVTDFCLKSVLCPFDRLDINTFLNHFPQWAKFTKS